MSMCCNNNHHAPLQAISATITANMKHHASQDRPDVLLGPAPAGRAAVEQLVLASLPPVVRGVRESAGKHHHRGLCAVAMFCVVAV